MVFIRKDDLVWTFAKSTFVLENGGKAIPADLAMSILSNDASPLRIKGNWRLETTKGKLVLSNLDIDGKKFGEEVRMPIEPAGPLRVNLGTRQYNLFRPMKKKPEGGV